MRTAKRIRYFCDFCSKSTGTRASMERHEKGCTANRNRECGLCAKAGDVVQRPMSELVAKATELFKPIGWPGIYGPAGVKAMQEFRSFAENCPACILATFRHCDPEMVVPTFNFQEELKSWWNETNAARAE